MRSLDLLDRSAGRLCFRIDSPGRGQIVAFDAPARAKADCGEGGTYLERLVGLPDSLIGPVVATYWPPTRIGTR